MHTYVWHGQKRGNLLNGIAHTYVCTYTYIWLVKRRQPFFSFRMYNFLFPAITYSRADEENWGCQSTNTFSSLKYWKQNLRSTTTRLLQKQYRYIFNFSVKNECMSYVTVGKLFCKIIYCLCYAIIAVKNKKVMRLLNNYTLHSITYFLSLRRA